MKIRNRAAVAAKAISECKSHHDLYWLGCDIARLSLNPAERKGLRRLYAEQRDEIDADNGMNRAALDEVTCWGCGANPSSPQCTCASYEA